MRLNQYIARLTGYSRKQADELILSGKVLVNEKKPEIGTRVGDQDQVKYLTHEKEWLILEQPTNSNSVLLMFKPIFTISSRHDPQGRKTIYDILPKAYHSFKPAGKLHFMSEGLMILSQDGNFIHSLTHPNFFQNKHYLLGLKIPIDRLLIKKALDGIVIDGYDLGSVVIQFPNLTQFSFLKPYDNFHWYEFIVSKGGNSQIRQLLKQWKVPVQRLIKIRHNGYTISPELVEKGWLISDKSGVK